MEESFDDFLKKQKKVFGNRIHKINKSYNTISGFKYYRSIKPNDKSFIISDKQYLSIIRQMNILMADYLIKNKSVSLPCGFGKLEIIKYETTSWIDKNGKFGTNKTIDIGKTLKLWYDDEDARENKTIVRYDDDFIFRIKYPTWWRKYKYSKYFSFQFNRGLRQKLKLAIQNGDYDTYKLIPYKQWVKQNGPT